MSKKNLKIITIFWFFKFIFDMFYTKKIFSIVITIFAILLLLFSIKEKKLKFGIADFFVLIIIILFTISFLKSPSFYIDYLKILSAFILYFLGRLLFEYIENIQKPITISLLLVFFINLIVCILGKGSIIWGNSNTLRGVYFFKTDFACALTTFLIFWLLNYKKNKIIKYSIVLVNLILILLANARIYYMISTIVIVMYLLFKHNKKIICIKTISTLLICSIIVIFGIQLLSNLTFFREKNFISLNFNSFDDLLNESNTQGRNIVWETLLYNFNNQNFLTRTFGTPLSFYSEYSYKGYSEHSTYIKVLLNTGYVGIIIFTFFIFSIFLSIKKVKNKKIEYTTFLLIAMFLISGISSPTLLYINTSWLPMFYSGVCISHSNQFFIKGDLNEK